MSKALAKDRYRIGELLVIDRDPSVKHTTAIVLGTYEVNMNGDPMIMMGNDPSTVSDDGNRGYVMMDNSTGIFYYLPFVDQYLGWVHRA